MLRTLWGLITTHPGLDASNVLTADLTLPRTRYPQPAQRTEVLRLMLGQGLTLVALGLVLGRFTALGVTQFLKSLLHGVEPTGTLTFAGVAA